MTHPRPLALLAALLASGACATFTGTAPGREALLSDADAPPGRPCRASADPAQLPAAAALVDSAALTAAARKLWRQAGSPPGYALLSMGYDAEGLNVRREVIEHRLPAELADTLQKLVFAHRRRVEPSPREWGVRLRMDLAEEEPVLRVGRREVCAAQPRDPAVAGYGAFGGASFDVREPSGAAGVLPPGGGTVWVHVVLDAGGNVTDARLERTLSRGTWEQRVLSYVRGISFVPAMEDGLPVPAQLRFPLRLVR
ncbi:MAG: energy transducer TonB [Gemmatimonadetes bacterium]|nr:energy transducer TonB [Gemmatimonadota bacterium]